MVKSKFFLRFVAGVMAAAASCFVMAGCSLLPQQEESREESVVSEEVSQIPAAFPAGTEVKGVDISGMTVKEAAEALGKFVRNEIKSIRVAVSFGENRLMVNGSNIVIETADLEAALKDYLENGTALPENLTAVSLDKSVTDRLAYWKENKV